MICQKCNKNINPLELYNGDWACPSCKAVLSVKSIAVKVNKENDETFKLSELCYLRALKCQKDAVKYERELGMAIDYCRTAARMGNPKALIRLGFYYEYGYITSDAFESFRIAYEYYKLVWNSSPEMDDRLPDRDYAESCKKLRSAAAKHYLELLKKMPESSRRVGELNYHDEKSKIIAKGLTVPDDDGTDPIIEENRIAHIIGTLQSCFSKERSPLFGVIRLEKGEFGELRQVGNTGKSTSSKIVEIARKLTIILFEADSGDFRTLKTADDCKNIDADNAYYLYFFNAYGQHGISERKCVKISKALRKSSGLGEYTGVKRIVEAMGRNVAQTDYIFSEDDVLMYKSRLEPMWHATDDLVNAVVNK